MLAEKVMKETVDIAKTGVKEGTNLIRKAWSLMEAASEKKTPQEYLSPKAIKDIQGQ